MKKLLLALIAVAGLGVLASTASAGHPYYAARPSCGASYYGGYGHGGYAYRPNTSIRLSYGSPGYFVPQYRPQSFYRAPVYGYAPYGRNFYGGNYGNRGGISFRIGF